MALSIAGASTMASARASPTLGSSIAGASAMNSARASHTLGSIKGRPVKSRSFLKSSLYADSFLGFSQWRKYHQDIAIHRKRFARKCSIHALLHSNSSSDHEPNANFWKMHNRLENYQPRPSNSAFVSFLVGYSVFVSDCWRIQSIAKNKVEEGISTAMPAVLSVGNLAAPVAQTVSQAASPVMHTVNGISVPVASTFGAVAQPLVEKMGQIAQPVSETIGQFPSSVVQTVQQFKFWPLDLLVERLGKNKNEEAISEVEKEVEAGIEEGAIDAVGSEDLQSGTDEDIASETVDELDPSFVWGQRAKDVEAEKERGPMGSPGFSFSAAGLLFPYHLGVTLCLMENGMIKEDTPLAGSSAGAIVCAVIASGIGMREALEATKELAKDCRDNGTVFRLGAVLRKFLEDFLPEDAHIRSSGRIRVAVTQLFKQPRSLLVDQFDSREDLINALITSSYVPGFLAPTPVTRFRNTLCIDGGLSSFIPPTASEKTVRVCAFPASALGFRGDGISPDLNPENRASMRQLFSWALEPADDFILDIMFEEGYRDALTWFRNRKGDDNDSDDSIDELEKDKQKEIEPREALIQVSS